jgi:transcription initiation factor TFIID subunit TAF12
MRHVIRATEASDPEAVITDALRRLPSSALDAFQRIALEQQLREALTSLVEQGRLLVAQGSQMRAERRVEGPGFQILIHFTAGSHITLWERLRRALGLA